MKTRRIDLKTVSDVLLERCPFIHFAFLRGIDPNGVADGTGRLELSVFVDPGTGTWEAIEKILPVMNDVFPGLSCDVTLLNHVDPASRFHAMNDVCLFVREQKEQAFSDFRRRSSLDYRILRAHQRRNGAAAVDD